MASNVDQGIAACPGPGILRVEGSSDWMFPGGKGGEERRSRHTC